MAEVAVGLEDVVAIADYSPATLLALAGRLERSASLQELIAREIELDEVWRRVETSLKDAQEQTARRTLRAVFDLVAEAHDLAGEGKPLDAAARLRKAVTLQGD